MYTARLGKWYSRIGTPPAPSVYTASTIGSVVSSERPSVTNT